MPRNPKSKSKDVKKAEIDNLKHVITNQNKIIKRLKKGIELKDIQTQTTSTENNSILELDIIKLNKANKELQLKLDDTNKKWQLKLNKIRTNTIEQNNAKWQLKLDDLNKKLEFLNIKRTEQEKIINNYISIDQQIRDIEIFKKKLKNKEREIINYTDYINTLKKDLNISLSKCRYAWKLMSDNYSNIYNEYLVNEYPNEYTYYDSKAVFDYRDMNLLSTDQNMKNSNIWNSALLLAK